MNETICNYDKINIKKICFGKTQNYNSNNYIPIYIKNNKKYSYLNIKSPRLFIPNKIINNSKYYLTLELIINNLNNKESNVFYKNIIKIEKIIKKQFKNEMKMREYVSCIKDNYESKKMYLSLNKNNNNFIDINYEKIDKFEIQSPTNGYFVITIKNIWFNEYKWGINLYFHSALILPSQKINSINLEPIKLKLIFSEELEENKNKSSIKDDPKYKTFFKMKSMRIPIMAIKNKMRLLGIDPDIIDYDENTDMKTLTKNNMNTTINNNDLLSRKKTLRKGKSIEKIVKTNTNLKTPSLDEIREAIKNMKNKK
jgi:hypothetical protein